jgi:hypothetical protein
MSGRSPPAVSWLFFAVLSACGASREKTVDADIGFRSHALMCEVTGLSAILQVSGVDAICPLTVNPDRTVIGTCEIPTGGIRMLRLVYSKEIDRQVVQLATASRNIDLTEPMEEVVVEFESGMLETDFDDDGDRVTNIVEVCTGRNPRLMDL